MLEQGPNKTGLVNNQSWIKEGLFPMNYWKLVDSGSRKNIVLNFALNRETWAHKGTRPVLLKVISQKLQMWMWACVENGGVDWWERDGRG